MSRYHGYGQLDDRINSSGDTYFTGINARLRGSQLQPGQVQVSENGRMEEDGSWVPRKGLSTLSGSITKFSQEIVLLYEIVSASRTNGFVTLIVSDPFNSLYQIDTSVTIQGLGFTGADPNTTAPIVSVTNSQGVLMYQNPGEDEVFTTTDAFVGLEGQANPVIPFVLTQTGGNQVFGSCVFTDPNTNATDDIIFTALDGYCQLLRARDKRSYKIKFPTNENVTERCDMIQAFNRVFLFRNTATTLQVTPQLTEQTINSASIASEVITIGVTNHGYTAEDFVTLSGLQGFSTYDPNGMFTVMAQNLTANSFQVSAEGAGAVSESYVTANAIVGQYNDFELVPDGDYQVPSYITDLNATALDGQISFNEPSHGLDIGDELKVVNGDGWGSPFYDLIGQTLRISEKVDDHNFKLTAPIENVPNGSTLVLSKKSPVSYLIHMPATPFAVVNQRRLWMPYFQYWDGTKWEASGNKDEIICSDVNDPTTYDVIGQRFRVTGGSNDFVVGIEPFTEDQLIVLARRSVHKLSGVSGSLNDVAVNVVTPDLGCNARRSIIQVGSKVLFLSDQGVYALEYLDQYNLRGVEVPLSEPIQPIINRINHDYVSKSVACYHDNRYWLAVPLDNSRENSHIIVYNFLAGAWESLDFVNSNNFKVRDLFVAREAGLNSLYITTSEGGIHKADGYEGGDRVSVQKGITIPEEINIKSKLVTRDYDLNTLDRKTFSRGELHVKSSNYSASNANFTFNSTDPDTSSPTIQFSELTGEELPPGEDIGYRTSVRLKGYSCSATIEPTKGRPYIRAVKVEGSLSDRETTSVK